MIVQATPVTGNIIISTYGERSNRNRLETKNYTKRSLFILGASGKKSSLMSIWISQLSELL